MEQNYKIIVVLILYITTINFSSAAYMNNTRIGLDNGAYITVMDTNFSSLKKYGITEDPQYTLEYTINGSRIRYTTETNKIALSPVFDVLKDNFSVQLSGNAGFLNFSVMMNNATDLYNFTSNSVFVEAKNASQDRIVYFNYTGAYPTKLIVSLNKTFYFIIEGYITDNLEWNIGEGARVDAINVTYTFTDSNGYYVIDNLRRGNYTILVRQIKEDENIGGVMEFINKTIQLELLNNTVLNVSLKDKQIPAIKASPGFEIVGLLFVFGILYIKRRCKH